MSHRTRTPLRGIPVRRPPTEGRPRRPSEEHGWSHFEQIVLENLEALTDGMATLAARVGVIETQRVAEGAERKVTDKIWRWALGILAALVIAGILALAKGRN